MNFKRKFNKDKKRVKQIITFVKEKGGIEYTSSKMEEYQQQALEILNTYPDSEYKNSLKLMVNYVIERKIQQFTYEKHISYLFVVFGFL